MVHLRCDLQPFIMEAALANEPEYRAYTVSNKGEGDQRKSRWTEIGAAWPTQSGDGYRIILEAVPVNGTVILLPPKQGDQEKQ